MTKGDFMVGLLILALLMGGLAVNCGCSNTNNAPTYANQPTPTP